MTPKAIGIAPQPAYCYVTCYTCSCVSRTSSYRNRSACVDRDAIISRRIHFDVWIIQNVFVEI
jgi:hypothetical protein